MSQEIDFEKMSRDSLKKFAKSKNLDVKILKSHKDEEVMELVKTAFTEGKFIDTSDIPGGKTRYKLTPSSWKGLHLGHIIFVDSKVDVESEEDIEFIESSEKFKAGLIERVED